MEKWPKCLNSLDNRVFQDGVPKDGCHTTLSRRSIPPVQSHRTCYERASGQSKP